MTLHQPQEQFTAGGSVRVTDILTSVAKEIDRILYETGHGGDLGPQRRANALRSLACRVRRLAETIEKGR